MLPCWCGCRRLVGGLVVYPGVRREGRGGWVAGEEVLQGLGRLAAIRGGAPLLLDGWWWDELER